MSRPTIQRCREWNARECSCDEAGGEGEGEEKKRPRDEFHPETRKGSGEGKVERIRSNSWNRRGGLPSYLCIKDANRYLSILPFQGGGAARVSWLQPKLKLHFTVVFQVVAELSRNFNIPRRERLKIQTATCHSIATFHAIPTHPILFSLLLSSPIPPTRASPRSDDKSFVQTTQLEPPSPYPCTLNVIENRDFLFSRFLDK